MLPATLSAITRMGEYRDYAAPSECGPESSTNASRFLPAGRWEMPERAAQVWYDAVAPARAAPRMSASTPGQSYRPDGQVSLIVAFHHVPQSAMSDLLY